MEESLVKELVKDVYRAGAFKTGDFKLTSGGLSPYYVDLRTLVSKPRLFERLVDSYISRMRMIGEGFDVVAGVETAGIPIATLISFKTGIPMVYVRSGEREHGTGRLVEGELEAGSRVVVVDDVLTTGRSIMSAVKSISVSGGRVVYALVFLDRLQNGVRRLREAGVTSYSVIKIDGFLKILLEDKLISESEYGRIMKYLEGFRNVEEQGSDRLNRVS
ncbi:MAG: orotate phosphoribosyltransferase [Thermoproteota archaeon]